MGLALSFSPFITGSAPLTTSVCTPRGPMGSAPRQSWQEFRKNSGTKEFKNSCPSLKERLQTRKGETENPEILRGESLTPSFLLLLPRTCPSTVKGSEVQAGQVLKRKV